MPAELHPPRLMMSLTLFRHGKGEIVKKDDALKTMQIIRVSEDGVSTVTFTREGDSGEYSYRMGDTNAQRDILKQFHAALLTDPDAVRVLQERADRHRGEIVHATH